MRDGTSGLQAGAGVPGEEGQEHVEDQEGLRVQHECRRTLLRQRPPREAHVRRTTHALQVPGTHITIPTPHTLTPRTHTHTTYRYHTNEQPGLSG